MIDYVDLERDSAMLKQAWHCSRCLLGSQSFDRCSSLLTLDRLKANFRLYSLNRRLRPMGDLLSFTQQRKLVNAGALKPERMEAFNKLMELMERYRRKNQYA